jgi:hypothetical protein
LLGFFAAALTKKFLFAWYGKFNDVKYTKTLLARNWRCEFSHSFFPEAARLMPLRREMRGVRAEYWPCFRRRERLGRVKASHMGAGFV